MSPPGSPPGLKAPKEKKRRSASLIPPLRSSESGGETSTVRVGLANLNEQLCAAMLGVVLSSTLSNDGGEGQQCMRRVRKKFSLLRRLINNKKYQICTACRYAKR